MKATFFALSLFILHTTALELTPDNWETHTAGKTVFLKFFAPWCGHCKKMKPDWDTLMKEYEGHPTILVADVDCIEAGASLCQQHGVKGFPTVKFGDPSNLEDYQGGRDLFSIQSHAAALKPACTFDNDEFCTAEEVEVMDTIRELTHEDIQAKVRALQDTAAKAESDFKERVTGLQQQYEGLVAAKEQALQSVKAQHLGLYLVAAAHYDAGKDEL